LKYIDFAEVGQARLQEGVLGKRGCELHLRVLGDKLMLELMITKGNKQKRQSRIGPALVSENGRLLTYFFPSKNQDNSLCSVCHPQSPIFPNSLFEPIIER
jgi:hypothetical protein